MKKQTNLFASWKGELKRLKLDYLKSAAPAFFDASGGYDMSVKPYRDTTSNGLTKCIIDYINFTGGYANRINTQGQVRKERIELAFGNYREKIQYTPSTTNKGTADINAIVDGRHWSIEVKIGNDRMSEHQIKEEARVNRAGGIYFIAKDMESFLAFYNTNKSNHK